MQMLHGQLLNFSFWNPQSSFSLGGKPRSKKRMTTSKGVI
jgi:hypothetical protein